MGFGLVPWNNSLGRFNDEITDFFTGNSLFISILFDNCSTWLDQKGMPLTFNSLLVDLVYLFVVLFSIFEFSIY